MPFSSVSGKAWSERIVGRLMNHCQYRSLLDVGAGSGTYYDLLKPVLPGVMFTALEVWEPYIAQYHLEAKYDSIIRSDVRNVELSQYYGVIILGDILEHMSKEEAVATYSKLLKHSEFVLISIPIIHYPQGEYMGNPFEIHVKDDWSHNEVLDSFGDIALSFVENEIGVYVGYNSELHSRDELLMINLPKYAVYATYQDDAEYIKKLLDSANNADELLLCDMGSQNETNDIIEAFQKRYPDTKLCYYKIYPSQGFMEDARNTALALVDPQADICIYIEAGGHLPKDWRRQLDGLWDAAFTRYDAGSHVHIHRRSGYMWKKSLEGKLILWCSSDEKVCRVGEWEDGSDDSVQGEI